MDSLVQDIYNAYKNKDCAKMHGLLLELEKKDPNNPYLQKYKKLFSDICNKKTLSTKKSKVKIWWKTIKCPHCWNYLRMNDKIKKTYLDYKQWKTSQLEFQCEYCWTKFVWNKTPVKPIFLSRKNVNIWKNIEIDNKIYRISSIVQYKWKRAESDEIWNLKYNEYLLVDKNWDIKYLSESLATWYWGSEEETELSWKVIPPFQILEITPSFIKTNKWNLTIKEVDKVKVKKIFWENTKSYTIWENIILYYFSYNWEDYILEKEGSSTQQEVWIYKRKYVNLSKYNKVVNNHFQNLSNFSELSKNIIILISIFFLINNIFNISSLIIKLFFLWILIYIIILSFDWKFANNLRSIIMLSGLIFFIIYTYLTFSSEQKEYKKWTTTKWLYKIKFDNNNKFKTYIWKRTYDYGWIQGKFKMYDWIKFAIKSDKDIETLKNIKEYIKNIKYFENLPHNDIYINNNKYPYNPEIIKQYLLKKFK